MWVKFHGPKKKHTGRLFLELAQKEQFLPGSVEIFSLEAAELEEIKRIEVSELFALVLYSRLCHLFFSASFQSWLTGR